MCRLAGGLARRLVAAKGRVKCHYMLNTLGYSAGLSQRKEGVAPRGCFGEGSVERIPAEEEFAELWHGAGQGLPWQRSAQQKRPGAVRRGLVGPLSQSAGRRRRSVARSASAGKLDHPGLCLSPTSTTLAKAVDDPRRDNMPRSFMKERVPSVRLACANDAALNPKGSFVLYWMTAFRRTSWNYALERAIELAAELRKPLLIVETLGSGDRWASNRHHAFVLQGMAGNRAACEARDVRYYPFVEFQRGDAVELVAALERRPNAASARGARPQLHADALGKEDPGMVGQPAQRPGRDDRTEQQVRTRRPGSELVFRDLLGPRALRPSVGAAAPDLRQGPLYELGEHGPEATGRAIPSGL